MHDPHTIRLNAAWEPPVGDGWLERRFARPSGLVAGERVWLANDAAACPRLELNGRPLGQPAGEGPPWRWEIRELLSSRNLLRLHADRAADATVQERAGSRGPLPACYGNVWLEIEAATS